MSDHSDDDGHRDDGKPHEPDGPTETAAATGQGGDPDARLSALAALFGTDGPPDLDDVTSPVHWPSLPATDAPGEWAALRGWVEHLVGRFSHLDHHVIPLCWWRHNGHVEALQALRDHERVSYADTAPGTAGVDWHRAFRDIEARLREWTAQLSCGAQHEPRPTRRSPVPDAEWNLFVDADVARREDETLRLAVEPG